MTFIFRDCCIQQGAGVQTSANQYFDNLQGRTLTCCLTTHRERRACKSSNLVAEMRHTEMLQLESRLAGVRLAAGELEKQIGTWAEGRLALYQRNSDSG